MLTETSPIRSAAARFPMRRAACLGTPAIPQTPFIRARPKFTTAARCTVRSAMNSTIPRCTMRPASWRLGWIASPVDCDELYARMIDTEPFLDFLITYSGHLGYDEIDALTTYALEQYPEYADDSRPYEINGLFAKARLTDDMFARLLERLAEDGLLEHSALRTTTIMPTV